MTEEQRNRYRAANRKAMKLYRQQKHRERMIGQGRCPVCEISLDQRYEPSHHGCPYFEGLHAKVDTNDDSVVLF